MPLNGQASGGWTESSSALRILNVGIRNSVGVATDDSFTQTNPSAVSANASTRVDTSVSGVMSGSVCFARPESSQQNFIGGAGSNATQVAMRTEVLGTYGFRALGIFINSAVGNDFENTPAVASGKCPYVSGQGTYATGLYETFAIATAGDPEVLAGTALSWTPGVGLIASRNGLLMPKWSLSTEGTATDMDQILLTAESFCTGVAGTAGSATNIGVIKMAPDATQAEVVFDQRL